MSLSNESARKFLKTDSEDLRPRLSFSEVESLSPELAGRIVLLRGRVKDLRAKFTEDANWALGWFNWVTGITILLAAASVLGGAIAVLMKFGSSSFSIAMGTTVIGLVALLAAAGAQAFGWHRRYRAMFRARWAMTALETNIDQVLHEIALGLGNDGKLSKEDRARLDQECKSWRNTFMVALGTFGEDYGSALTPVEIPKLKP